MPWLKTTQVDSLTVWDIRSYLGLKSRCQWDEFLLEALGRICCLAFLFQLLEVSRAVAPHQHHIAFLLVVPIFTHPTVDSDPPTCLL